MQDFFFRTREYRRSGLPLAQAYAQLDGLKGLGERTLGRGDLIGGVREEGLNFLEPLGLGAEDLQRVEVGLDRLIARGRRLAGQRGHRLG